MPAPSYRLTTSSATSWLSPQPCARAASRRTSSLSLTLSETDRLHGLRAKRARTIGTAFCSPTCLPWRTSAAKVFSGSSKFPGHEVGPARAELRRLRAGVGRHHGFGPAQLEPGYLGRGQALPVTRGACSRQLRGHASRPGGRALQHAARPSGGGNPARSRLVVFSRVAVVRDRAGPTGSSSSGRARQSV